MKHALKIGALALLGLALANCGDKHEPRTLYESPAFTLMTDKVSEGEWTATALSDHELQSSYRVEDTENTSGRWALSANIDRYPDFQTDAPLLVALHKLSLEELEKLRTPDGKLLNTGAKWAGVWTRDVSYSIVLALAYLDPQTAMDCLRQKVKNGKIIQDTGTGGSWPISTDRMTWALAAWEIYRVTADTQWLKESFEIIAASAKADTYIAFGEGTLALGESSFLDWREQSYPRWMDPVDIYASEALGTNAVHAATYEILIRMSERLGLPAEAYAERRERLVAQLNGRLWSDSLGYFQQFTYGRHYPALSPRPEALGEALCVLYDLTDSERGRSILRQFPVTPYGTPCFYPQIPDIPPYHNDAIWPFVQGFWNLAAAKVGNQDALLHGMASLYRAAALFLTNKENLVASTGHPDGTELNSDRQLWSVAANLAMTYRVLLGMAFEPEGIRFAPSVPEPFAGTYTAEGFRYRQATLDITVEGWGNQIERFELDGEPADAFLPGDLQGNHTVHIILKANGFTADKQNLVENHFSLPAPEAVAKEDVFVWKPVEWAERYIVFRDGKAWASVAEPTEFKVESPALVVMQVLAVDKLGWQSFLSEPVLFHPEALFGEAETVGTAKADGATGFSGSGFIETTQELNNELTFSFEAPAEGEYWLDFRFSNGNGPLNTENKCAIRSYKFNGEYRGAFVFPQLGEPGDWSHWGYSNPIRVEVRKGQNELVLYYEAMDENMNGAENRAFLDHLRVIPAR